MCSELPCKQHPLIVFDDVLVSRPNAVFVLDAPEKMLLARLRQSSADSPELLLSRIMNYWLDTVPLLKKYERSGVLYHLNARTYCDTVFDEFLEKAAPYLSLAEKE